MPYQDIEESRMYERAEQLADEIWDAVISWQPFARDTVSKQLTKSADSVGANIAESSGRFHPKDVINFLYYARGSLKETRYWLRRAIRRKLITQEQFNRWMDELTQLAKEINSYIGCNYSGYSDLDTEIPKISLCSSVRCSVKLCVTAQAE
ncbi:MAG: four helix bundle protein [Anaerolineae bacterium]